MKKIILRSSISALLLVAVITGLFTLNLYTFNRLTDEALIAKLRFTQDAEQTYQVELRTGDFCQPVVYPIYGDEWRVDAQFLKWKPWANLLGMDARYRLERLGGRYHDVQAENTGKHLVHDISQQPVIDLLRYSGRSWAGWMPVDTLFGSSVYEKIDPAVEYYVYRAQSGLLVRKQSLATAHYENGKLVIPIEKGCSAAG
jgi:hypothetical protein